MLDLETEGGPDWAGWKLHEGLIYAPEWRKGLHTGEIRALPYLYASVADYRRRVTVAEAALQEMEGLCMQAERQARYYRDLVSREAHLGLMLCRISG